MYQIASANVYLYGKCNKSICGYTFKRQVKMVAFAWFGEIPPQGTKLYYLRRKNYWRINSGTAGTAGFYERYG